MNLETAHDVARGALFILGYVAVIVGTAAALVGALNDGRWGLVALVIVIAAVGLSAVLTAMLGPVRRL